MITSLALLGTASALAGAALLITFRHSRIIGWMGATLGVCGLAGMDVAAVLRHNWFLTAYYTAWLLYLAWFWWRKRRNHRRAPRAYGTKSRARLAALVATLRERARPRPVLRPVPGGVR